MGFEELKKKQSKYYVIYKYYVIFKFKTLRHIQVMFEDKGAAKGCPWNLAGIASNIFMYLPYTQLALDLKLLLTINP